jgi:multidrug efflux pump subunit AcrA (membrane-fusion protein)
LPDDAPFLIGMSVDVNIIVRTVEGAVQIPRAALDGAAVMLVGADQTVSRVALKVGIRGARDVEVVDGLKDDARVIVPYPVGLRPGQKVAASARPTGR